MESLDELKSILRKMVKVLEISELAAAFRLRAQSGAATSQSISAEASDEETSEGYNAIRREIDALR